jgi:hypothetical protein
MMGLSHEGKTEQAFRRADEWSRSCPEKYDPVELRKKWNSLTPGKAGGITVVHNGRTYRTALAWLDGRLGGRFPALLCPGCAREEKLVSGS